MLVNGFGTANSTDIATLVAGTSYSCHWNGPRASYSCSKGIFFVLYCIMIVSCICTLFGAILLKKNSKKNQQIKRKLNFLGVFLSKPKKNLEGLAPKTSGLG